MTTTHAPPDSWLSSYTPPPGRSARRKSERPARRRVRRAPAVAVLRAPPLAVWAGEVLLLVGPEPARLLAAACALEAASGGRVRVAYLRAATSAGAAALLARASPSAAVVAAVRLPTTVRAPAAAEALRRAVARAVPCRCARLPAAGPSDACVVPLTGPL